MLPPRADLSRPPYLGPRQAALLASARAGWRSGAPTLTAEPRERASAQAAADRGLLRRLSAGHLPVGTAAWAITPAGLAELARYEHHALCAAEAPQGAGSGHAARSPGSARDRAALLKEIAR